MKQKVLLSLLAVLMPLVAWADVWQDPVYKVRYDYEPGSGVASVLSARYPIYGSSGSSVEGDVVILGKIVVNDVEYIVTKIGWDAFLGQDRMTSVSIPNTVKTIEGRAFINCTGLTSVFFEENSVVNIERWAFADCSSLTSIVFPNSLTNIGDNAFLRCYNLKSVELSNSLTTIETAAFAECSLTSIAIPKSVKHIGGAAFACESLIDVHISGFAAWCSIEFENSGSNPLNYAKHFYLNNKEITDVEIPEGTTCISDYAFCNFSGMTSVKIPNTVTSIGKEAFRNCQGLTSIIFPNSVESIGEWAFGECSGLKYVIIGKGFKSIGGSAFSHCWVLSDVYCLAEKGPSAGGYVTNQAPDPLLHVPSASVESHKKAEWWGGSFRDVVPLEPGDPGYEDDDIITFADAKVKHICVTNWDTNGDGELSKTEAAAVTSIGGVFEGHDIKSFEEFQYFTGVTLTFAPDYR